jgi:hypothetical protein
MTASESFPISFIVNRIIDVFPKILKSFFDDIERREKYKSSNIFIEIVAKDCAADGIAANDIALSP